MCVFGVGVFCTYIPTCIVKSEVFYRPLVILCLFPMCVNCAEINSYPFFQTQPGKLFTPSTQKSSLNIRHMKPHSNRI